MSPETAVAPQSLGSRGADTMVRFQTSPVTAEDSGHVALHGGSIALAIITQVCSDIFFTFTKDSSVPNALFQTSSRNVSETFSLEVTMDWWSESNWIMTDFWAKASLAYAVVGLFRRNTLGPVSCNPEIHPPAFYLMWAAVNGARICSLCLWDRHDLVGAVALTWLVSALTFFLLFVSYYNLGRYKAWLNINSPSEIWWIRYLIQNGLALSAWWTFLNAVVGFGIVLRYKAGVQDPLASTVVLTTILLCSLTWFFLQSFQFLKYMRYTFTVYAILILGLGAMFTRSYRVNDLSENTIYCGFLMLLMTIMSLLHLISACLYAPRRSQRPVVEPYSMFPSFETVCRPEGKDHLKLQGMTS